MRLRTHGRQTMVTETIIAKQPIFMPISFITCLYTEQQSHSSV